MDKFKNEINEVSETLSKCSTTQIRDYNAHASVALEKVEGAEIRVFRKFDDLYKHAQGKYLFGYTMYSDRFNPEKVVPIPVNKSICIKAATSKSGFRCLTLESHVTGVNRRFVKTYVSEKSLDKFLIFAYGVFDDEEVKVVNIDI